jgi:hypothetical protein
MAYQCAHVPRSPCACMESWMQDGHIRDGRWSKWTIADEFGTILSVCFPHFPEALEQALVELLQEIGLVVVLSANLFTSATEACATAASAGSMAAFDADDQYTLTQAVGILWHVCELECGRRCSVAESRLTRSLRVTALAEESAALLKPVVPHRWRRRYASTEEPPSKLPRALGSLQAVEDEVTKSLCLRLWEAFEKMGSRSQKWLDLNALMSSDQRAAKAEMLRLWSHSSASNLKGVLATLKHFEDFCGLRGQGAIKSPSGPLVTLFLASRREYGVTSEKRALTNLRWASKSLGLGLPVGDIVLHAGSEARIREVSQATPLDPRALTMLDMCLRSSSPFVVWLAAIWTIIWSGTLRFAHVQRAVGLRLDGEVMYAKVLRGKSRRGGVRRPFYIVVPRYSLAGTDVGAVLERALLAALPLDCQSVREEQLRCTWLLYDFGPARAPLDALCSVEPRAMPLARFHRLSRQMFARFGHSPPGARGAEGCALTWVTSYSARRVSPTIADVLKFPPGDRLKVGGWLNEEVTTDAKIAKMPDTYSDERLTLAGHIKREIVHTVRSALRKSGVPAPDLKWSDFLKNAPTRAAMRAEIDSQLDVPTVKQQCSAEFSFLKVAGLPPVSLSSDSETDAFSASGPDTSGPSSDSSSEDETPVDLEVSWLQTANSRRRLHILGVDRCPESRTYDAFTACGRGLFNAKSGLGLTSAAEIDPIPIWSPRCWGKLSSSQRGAWSSAVLQQRTVRSAADEGK